MFIIIMRMQMRSMIQIDLIILLSHVLTLGLSTFAKLNRTALINRDNLGITDVKLADRNLYLLQIKLTDVHRNPWNPRSKVVCKLRFDWRKPENEQSIASPKMSTIFWSFEHVRATFERSGSRLISEFS